METKKKRILIFLAAVPVTYSFGLFTPMSRSILWLLLYGMSSSLLIYAWEKQPGRKANLAAGILGLLFSCFLAAGYELSSEGHLAFYWMIVFQLFGMAILLYAVLRILFSAVLSCPYLMSAEATSAGNPADPGNHDSVRQTAITAVLLLLCWLPYFLIFYPGTMSSDALGELRQQLGMSPLTNHHPVIHQLMIRLCLILGRMSPEKGTAVYSALQMSIFSVVYGAAVIFIRNRTGSRWPAAITFCYYAFFPVHPLYAIMMEKGSAMAPAAVALILLLMKETEGAERTSGWRFAGIILCSFLFCTLRNNGLYAYLIGIVIVIIGAGKNRLRILITAACSLVLIFSYRFVLFDVLDVPASSSGETLSIPLQQISRTAMEYPEELESDEFTTLREIFSDVSELSEKYDPLCADPVKAPGTFLSAIFDQEPGKYLKAWINLGLRHPRCYLEAFLMQNYGYWYPDTDEPAVTYVIYEPNDFGLTNNKKLESIRWKLISLLGELQSRRPTAIFFSIALRFWLLTITFTILWLRGCREYAFPLLLIAALWLTTLASPVYCSYRYLYPMAAVPCMFYLSHRRSGIKEVF